MKLGALFPQTEIGPDPAAVRSWAQGAEEMGFDYVATYEHVLGASPDRPEKLRGPYRDVHLFHEPFVLFGFLTAHTSRVELVTEVLVLPQRQTALVAKQAAEVDVLSGGRFRMGVGIGWNHVEFEALGMDFHDRGRRLEEQVELLRLLWSEDVVDFAGRYHRVSKAGIRPRPTRAIPIWMGGTADTALRRAARIADGWTANMRLGPDLERAVDLVRAELRAAGRDPAAFGFAGRVGLQEGVDGAARDAARWRDLGVTHLSVNTMGADLRRPDDHLDALRAVRDAVASA